MSRRASGEEGTGGCGADVYDGGGAGGVCGGACTVGVVGGELKEVEEFWGRERVRWVLFLQHLFFN